MGYITMKQMLETGVHFGHQTRRWNPKMRSYIFGARNGIHIIDLQQTVRLFQTAHDFIADTVAEGGSVIFVGTKRQAQESVKAEAERAGQFHTTNRWMGGTLTNFQTIKRSIERLKKLEQMFEDGTVNRYTKKEVAGMSRELDKLELSLGGIKNMDSLPSAAFIIDTKREEIAVLECRKLGIPIVAVVDSNCDPDMVDYVIPGNDDAIRAIKLFVSHIADACLEGQARLEETQPAQAEKPEPKAKVDESEAQAAVKAEKPEPEAQTPPAPAGTGPSADEKAEAAEAEVAAAPQPEAAEAQAASKAQGPESADSKEEE
jgi:small subunit ribosomal protein S2